MGKAPNIDAEQPCGSEFTRFNMAVRWVVAQFVAFRSAKGRSFAERKTTFERTVPPLSGEVPNLSRSWSPVTYKM